MKFRSLSSGITAAVMVVSCMAPMRIVAQSRSTPELVQSAIKAASAKPTPRVDGHPDLNGYWTFPEFDVSAHRDSKGNFYIDVPPAKGGTLPKLDATLSEQLRAPGGSESASVQA